MGPTVCNNIQQLLVLEERNIKNDFLQTTHKFNERKYSYTTVIFKIF